MRQVAFLLLAVAIWLTASPVLAGESLTIPQSRFGATRFSWIRFLANGAEVARVDEDCKIVTSVIVGKHIMAELRRYSGICMDLKEVERNLAEKSPGGFK